MSKVPEQKAEVILISVRDEGTIFVRPAMSIKARIPETQKTIVFDNLSKKDITLVVSKDLKENEAIISFKYISQDVPWPSKPKKVLIPAGYHNVTVICSPH